MNNVAGAALQELCDKTRSHFLMLQCMDLNVRNAANYMLSNLIRLYTLFFLQKRQIEVLYAQ